MGKSLLCLLLVAACAYAPTDDEPEIPVFYTEEAYRKAVQDLQDRINQVWSESRDEDAAVGEALYHTIENERSRIELVDRVSRLRNELAQAEGAFEASEPHLVRAIATLEKIVADWEARVATDSGAIEQYDIYSNRLQQLRAELARKRGAALDQAALDAKKAELAQAESQLHDLGYEIVRWQRRLQDAKVALDTALGPLPGLEKELNSLKANAARAMAGVRPPLLVAFRSDNYDAEWVGKERSDKAALDLLEAKMLVAERQLQGVLDELSEVDRGMRRQENEILKLNEDYVALTQRMATTAWVDAVLRTTIESADAIKDTVKSSGGSPTGILINSAIEIGTRYDAFIMGYNYLAGNSLGEGAPSQRMAVAAENLLEARHRLAGNAVIEAYRFYGLPTPPIEGAPNGGSLPNLPSSASGLDHSLAGFAADFAFNTDRVKDFVKANVQDSISDVAEELVKAGLSSSIHSTNTGAWRKVLQAVPANAREITSRMVHSANPHFSREMARVQSELIENTARRAIAYDTIKQRFSQTFKDIWNADGYKKKWQEFKANPSALKSFGEEALVSLSQEAIDSIEDCIRDGIMSDMVAIEITWLQVRKAYHFLGAHRQLLVMAKDNYGQELDAIRAEYSRIAGRDGGRTLVINKSQVFDPGTYSARLEFSHPVLDFTVTSSEVEIVGTPKLENDRHFGTFQFKVSGNGGGPVSAQFAVGARDDDTQKPIDGDPATDPYFDGRGQAWSYYEHTPDVSHQIRLKATEAGTSIMILLDDSGSMGNEARFPKAQQGIKDLLKTLRDRKRSVEVALWTFSSGEAPAVAFTGDLAAVEAAVDAASPSTSTPLARTIGVAGNHLFSHTRYRARVFYIFSDGMDSEGGDPVAALDRVRRRAVEVQKSGW